MSTIRGRTFAAIALVALVSAAATTVIAAILTQRQLQSDSRERVGRQAAAVATALGSVDSPGPQRTRIFLVDGPRFVPLERGPLLDAVRRALATGRPTGALRVGDRDVRFAARRTRLGPVVLVRDGASRSTTFAPYGLGLSIAAIVALLLAGVLSWLLARRLTEPIAALATATERLARNPDDGEHVVADGPSELVALAGSFNEMSDRLAKTRAAEREFLMLVSHELKTPLTSVRAYAEALTDGTIEVTLAGEAIGEEAQRLERLVRDLLDLAQLARGGFSVTPQDADLATIAHRVCQGQLLTARSRGIELRIEGGPAPAWIDPDRTQQVLLNLVENAIRCTPPGGEIVIAVAPGRCSVSDTGPGLSVEDLRHAFERFYLHERHGGASGVGSGLGLALVAELTRLMGGTITVESTLGRGTTFTVSVATATGVRDPGPAATFTDAGAR